MPAIIYDKHIVQEGDNISRVIKNDNKKNNVTINIIRLSTIATHPQFYLLYTVFLKQKYKPNDPLVYLLI